MEEQEEEVVVKRPAADLADPVEVDLVKVEPVEAGLVGSLLVKAEEQVEVAQVGVAVPKAQVAA